MAEIISLSKVRKAKARAEKEDKAAQNRIAFGRTKAEKRLEAAKKDAEGKKLDGYKLDE